VAVAKSFIGFNNKMDEVGRNTANNEPLSTLCENTLKIIATPPGRIYDKHKLTYSPTDEAMKIVEGGTKAVAGLKPKGL
jgi:hypothetical protein